MKKANKIRQIVIRFDDDSYSQISELAKMEHRGLGEFVRHTALYYVEHFGDSLPKKKRQTQEDKE